MGNIPSERRLAENEVIFRECNESVQKGIDAVNEIAREEGANLISLEGDEALFFHCECSNEDCKERIKISPNNYTAAHQSRDTFTILRGHEIPSVEYIIAEAEGYVLVKKRVQPPDTAERLQPTDTIKP